MSTVAIICNTGLGDAIVFERIAHAMQQHAVICYIYTRFLSQLASLYPHLHIRSYPDDIDDPSSEFWHEHAHYIFQEYAPGSHANLNHPRRAVLGESYKRKHQSWQDHQIDFLRQEGFDVTGPLKTSLKTPLHWKYRSHTRRIVIHPTSLLEDKNWLPEKFLSLAQGLQRDQWQLIFCATTAEKQLWDPMLEAHGLPLMLAASLEELAHQIYESAYFIGNDSGVAHLAGALGIPTLKIFDRASRARFWSGGWEATREVLPLPIPLRTWRRRYWKKLLSVARVRCHFEALTREFPLPGPILNCQTDYQ